MISDLRGKEAERPQVKGRPIIFTNSPGLPSQLQPPFSHSSCSRELSAQAPSHLIEGRTHYDTADSTALLCQAKRGARARDRLCTRHPYPRD